jgi:hypothetical protein
MYNYTLCIIPFCILKQNFEYVVFYFCVLHVPRDSVDGIVTGYGLHDRGVGVRVSIVKKLFTTLLHSDGNYSIVACEFVAAGMCLPRNCLAMDYSSKFTIQAFGRHVTIIFIFIAVPMYLNFAIYCYCQYQYCNEYMNNCRFRL